MAERSKADVKRPAAGAHTGFPEGENFGVGLAGAVVIPLAHNAAFRGDDRSDHRVGARAPSSLGRKTECTRNVETIEIGGIHRVLRDVDLPPVARIAPACFFDRTAALTLPFLVPRSEAGT